MSRSCKILREKTDNEKLLRLNAIGKQAVSAATTPNSIWFDTLLRHINREYKKEDESILMIYFAWFHVFFCSTFLATVIWLDIREPADICMFERPFVSMFLCAMHPLIYWFPSSPHGHQKCRKPYIKIQLNFVLLPYSFHTVNVEQQNDRTADSRWHQGVINYEQQLANDNELWMERIGTTLPNEIKVQWTWTQPSLIICKLDLWSLQWQRIAPCMT